MEYNIWKKDGGQNFEPNVTDQIWGRLQKKDNWYGFEKDPIKQREIGVILYIILMKKNKKKNDIGLYIKFYFIKYINIIYI